MFNFVKHTAINIKKTTVYLQDLRQPGSYYSDQHFFFNANSILKMCTFSSTQDVQETTTWETSVRFQYRRWYKCTWNGFNISAVHVGQKMEKPFKVWLSNVYSWKNLRANWDNWNKAKLLAVYGIFAQRSNLSWRLSSILV